MCKNQDCQPKKRIIYKSDGTVRSDGNLIVRNWIGILLGIYYSRIYAKFVWIC